MMIARLKIDAMIVTLRMNRSPARKRMPSPISVQMLRRDARSGTVSLILIVDSAIAETMKEAASAAIAMGAVRA